MRQAAGCGKNGFVVNFYPPAVIIHGLADARLALSLRRPVTLLSAPAAALYAGCLWWQSLIAAAETDQPAFLDCADAPGRAAEALRAGQRRILFRPETSALLASVASMAEAYGEEIWTERPPSLDMATRGAERQLAVWLAGPRTSG